MLIIFLLFAGVVLASGLCSMAEAAILSLPFVRVRILKEQNHPRAQDLLHIKEKLTHVIACIVVVNNAVNIIGSIFIGQQVALRFGNKWLAVASALLTFAIILFAEIIPKTLGERYKVSLSIFFAKPLLWTLWALGPFIGALARITKPLTKSQQLPKVTEDEIKIMLKLGRAAGTVEMDEEDLINRVFKLNDVRAQQIMRSIEQIYSLSANQTLLDAKDAIINSPFSRIAVYDSDPEDIIGIVQHRILLREIAKDNYSAKIKEFMHEPIFVHQLTKADTLLQKFQQHNQHLFIVQDNIGNDVGLVTMEDVLEELFGEIYDEKDIKPKMMYNTHQQD